MKKNFLMTLSALLLASTLVGCGEPNNDSSSNGGTTSNHYDIKVWAAENAVSLTETQLAKFKADNPNYDVTFTVEAQGEGDAASNMITDVEAGADIFCFAQDQLTRLKTAGALAKVTGTVAEEIKANNDGGSVSAATINGDLYAYPLTSDNGYFMYYDKRFINEDHLNDMSALIKDCKDNGKLFSFQLGEDGGWYNAAFFFATGCESTWTPDDSGKLSSYVDTYSSANGLIAAKGMKELITSGVWNNASGAPSAFASDSAIVISGTWDYAETVKVLGDNLGVTDLPEFTVDGKSYHLGSFGGFKLMGVKPQTDSTKAAICSLVAKYLTGETCQNERFEALAWGPSNVNAQNSDAVKSNPALVALALQSQHAVPQGQYPDGWWSLAAAIGSDIFTAGADATDDQLDNILKTYAAGLDACKQ